MRAVITGATGFLGYHLAARLVDEGVTPVCLRRPGPLPGHCRELPVLWDDQAYTDSGRLQALCTDADVIFHCAARTGTARRAGADMVAANLTLTQRLLAAARDSAARFVYCSSVATLGLAQGGEAVDEGGGQWPGEVPGGYAATKKAAEELVQQAVAEGLDGVIVHPGYMIGPCDWKPGSCRLVLDVCRGKLPGYPPGTNNYVDVRDVARGMVLVASGGRSGERYILGGENLDYCQLFARIAHLAGVPPIAAPLSPRLARVAGVVGNVVERLSGREVLFNSTGIAYAMMAFRYTSAKAATELGYVAGDLDLAIADCIRWFRDNGYLPERK